MPVGLQGSEMGGWCCWLLQGHFLPSCYAALETFSGAVHQGERSTVGSAGHTALKYCHPPEASALSARNTTRTLDRNRAPVVDHLQVPSAAA
jgi:hypothetical protein